MYLDVREANLDRHIIFVGIEEDHAYGCDRSVSINVETPGGDIWEIGRLTEKGLILTTGLPDESGFPVDKDGRIKLVK